MIAIAREEFRYPSAIARQVFRSILVFAVEIAREGPEDPLLTLATVVVIVILVVLSLLFHLFHYKFVLGGILKSL
jgi:hypothetical protein